MEFIQLREGSEAGKKPEFLNFKFIDTKWACRYCRKQLMLKNPQALAVFSAFNKKICDGIKYSEKGKYLKAIEIFESAINMSFHEQPDYGYRLYPRLASTYLLNNDLKNSIDALNKAEIALQVDACIFFCKEKNDGYTIINQNGMEISSPHHDEIANKMCNLFTIDNYYAPQSMEELIDKARLIEYYLKVKDQIKKSTLKHHEK